MFKGIRIDRSKLVSLVVLTILIMIIGVSAARAQSTGGTTTRVTGAANVQGGAQSNVVTPAKRYTLGLTGIPIVGAGGINAFDKDCDPKGPNKDCDCDPNDHKGDDKDCHHHPPPPPPNHSPHK